MVTALLARAVHLDPARLLLSAAGHDTWRLRHWAARDRAGRRFAERTPDRGGSGA